MKENIAASQTSTQPSALQSPPPTLDSPHSSDDQVEVEEVDTEPSNSQERTTKGKGKGKSSSQDTTTDELVATLAPLQQQQQQNERLQRQVRSALEPTTLPPASMLLGSMVDSRVHVDLLHRLYADCMSLLVRYMDQTTAMTSTASPPVIQPQHMLPPQTLPHLEPQQVGFQPIQNPFGVKSTFGEYWTIVNLI